MGKSPYKYQDCSLDPKDLCKNSNSNKISTEFFCSPKQRHFTGSLGCPAARSVVAGTTLGQEGPTVWNRFPPSKTVHHLTKIRMLQDSGITPQKLFSLEKPCLETARSTALQTQHYTTPGRTTTHSASIPFKS